MINDLPIYNITIDDEYSDGEDLGITQIAFTSIPAIKVKGMAFNEQIEEPKQFFADKLKYRIVAPAMIPMKIYRADDQEEYYVQFSAQEIDKIHSKFMKKFNNQNVFNLEHNTDITVPAYILETWIVENPEQDKSFSTYGIKVPKGTLMVTSQLTDKQKYQELVDNEQTGYSIEGFLGMSLSEIINKNKTKQEKMETKQMMLPAGEYVMGDKTYVVAEDGTFEIKETKMAEPAPVEEVKTEYAAEPMPSDMAPTDVPSEVAPTTDMAPQVESYSKEEIDAKFDELYQIIAEMKNEDVSEDVTEITTEVAPVQMSAHQRFEAFVRFAKNK